jgi:uncharacterized protein involved in cysteine biosynthesis
MAPAAHWGALPGARGVVEWAMLSALIKAFAQLGDPKLKRVLKRGVLGALAVYAGAATASWAVLTHVQFQQDWARWLAEGALVVSTLVLPLLYFPAAATAVMSFWLEDVAEAVEERHYPHLNWPRPQKWAEVLATTLRFLAVMVAANLAALPLYGVLLFFGLTPVVAYGLNGYLLGREYFELVAARRLEPAKARILFRNRLGRWWLGGVVIALMFSVPGLNLLAPVIGTAFMVHLFQSLQNPELSV